MFDSYEQEIKKAEELATHKTGTILYRVAPIFRGYSFEGELEKYIVSNIPCRVVGVSIEDGRVEHYIRSCDTIRIDNEAFTDIVIDNEIAGERNNHGNYYYFTKQIQAEEHCAELNAKLQIK
jgi:hypothetical protein